MFAGHNPTDELCHKLWSKRSKMSYSEFELIFQSLGPPPTEDDLVDMFRYSTDNNYAPLSICKTPKNYFITKILHIKKVPTPTLYHILQHWNSCRVQNSALRVRVPTLYDTESNVSTLQMLMHHYLPGWSVSSLAAFM